MTTARRRLAVHHVLAVQPVRGSCICLDSSRTTFGPVPSPSIAFNYVPCLRLCHKKLNRSPGNVSRRSLPGTTTSWNALIILSGDSQEVARVTDEVK